MRTEHHWATLALASLLAACVTRDGLEDLQRDVASGAGTTDEADQTSASHDGGDEHDSSQPETTTPTPEPEPEPEPEVDPPRVCKAAALGLPHERMRQVPDGYPPELDEHVIIELGTSTMGCDGSGYACETWEVSLLLPPEAQTPGVYELGDPDFAAWLWSSRSVPDYPGACVGKGGPAPGGTLEIFYVDDNVIVGALCDVFLEEEELELDGAFVALGC